MNGQAVDYENSVGMEGAGAGGQEGGRRSASKVARQMKAGASRKTRAQTLARGGPGSAKARADHAAEKYRNDPFKQMMYFLHDLDLQAYTGRRRAVSEIGRAHV